MKNVIYSLLIILSFTLTNCKEKGVKLISNNNSTAINSNIASRLFQQCNTKFICTIAVKQVTTFKWDKVYIFSSRSSLEEINKALGFSYEDWTDIGQRIIFVLNHHVVYHEEYFPQPSLKEGTTIFQLDNSYYVGEYDNATFIVEKFKTKSGRFHYIVTPKI